MPHNFPTDFSEEVFNVRTLSKDQLKEARKRMKALDKRDEDRLKNDEAKNEFETVIYAFRAWLNEDENTPYVSENDRENWLS